MLDGGTWTQLKKTEYDYDSRGNRILRASYEWNEATQQWVGDFKKVEYIYDDNDNRTSLIEFDWNTDTQQWQPTRRGSGGYGEILLDELIIPDYRYDIFMIYANTNQTYGESHNWDEANQTWVLTFRSEYHYSSVITAVENINTSHLHIFPNPTNNLINFDIENPTSTTITIHDVQGKYISTQHLQDKRLSVGHFNSGIYFYQLSHNGEMYSGKFIVK